MIAILMLNRNRVPSAAQRSLPDNHPFLLMIVCSWILGGWLVLVTIHAMGLLLGIKRISPHKIGAKVAKPRRAFPCWGCDGILA
jgi:hypothetical protein